MSEKETKILETFGKVIPQLSEGDKKYLLGLGEGMAIRQQQDSKEKDEEKVGV